MSTRTSWIRRLDRASLGVMGLGLALMLVVPEAWSFRVGFFVVLAGTVAQIVFSHLGSEGA